MSACPCSTWTRPAPNCRIGWKRRWGFSTALQCPALTPAQLHNPANGPDNYATRSWSYGVNYYMIPRNPSSDPANVGVQWMGRATWKRLSKTILYGDYANGAAGYDLIKPNYGGSQACAIEHLRTNYSGFLRLPSLRHANRSGNYVYGDGHAQNHPIEFMRYDVINAYPSSNHPLVWYNVGNY